MIIADRIRLQNPLAMTLRRLSKLKRLSDRRETPVVGEPTSCAGSSVPRGRTEAWLLRSVNVGADAILDGGDVKRRGLQDVETLHLHTWEGPLHPVVLEEHDVLQVNSHNASACAQRMV
jgi:hypothetical protein